MGIEIRRSTGGTEGGQCGRRKGQCGQKDGCCTAAGSEGVPAKSTGRMVRGTDHPGELCSQWTGRRMEG
eukprot:13760851-Heterocapsa_arctica.AAC.1